MKESGLDNRYRDEKSPKAGEIQQRLEVILSIKPSKGNSRLEFKLRVELGKPDATAEFVSDVISLANSEGECPREYGLLVIGFRDGEYQDVACEHYEGAKFNQIIEANVFPVLNDEYEEFSNGRHGHAEVLIIKGDPDILYVARKKIKADNTVYLHAGQCWERREDGKIELTGDEIYQRNQEILVRKLTNATAELQQRIERLEREHGAALEVQRIRFEMEATREWSQLEPLVARLRPYAREFDDKVKNQVLYALNEVTARAWQGMTTEVAHEVDSVLGMLMPLGGGGMNFPARQEIASQDQELLEKIGDRTFEMMWNACCYLRNIELVKITARRFWYLIRFATLNSLRYLQQRFLEDARSCENVSGEEREGKVFAEACKEIKEQVAHALDVFGDNYVIVIVHSEDVAGAMLSDCVAIIKKGNAVDWRSAKKELPLATLIGVAYKDSQIVGVGVIKRDRRKYATKISRRSGVVFPPETLELGYVAVEPEDQNRGLSRRIVDALTANYKGRLFATTYSRHMKKTLIGAGFIQKGREWKGQNDILSFWDRE